MHRNTSLLLWTLAIGCAMAAGGCSRTGLEGTIPIAGEVSYNGQPLSSGSVHYLPVDGAGRAACGTIDGNGRFSLTTLKASDGALPGEYRIVVVVRDARFDDLTRRAFDENLALTKFDIKPPIPARYFAAETSGLTDVVSDEHSGYKTLALVD